MKAVIYSRKSKFKEEGESIENQINMCKEYAERVLGIEEFDIYQDEGFSGGNTNRPQYKIMMKKIKEKKYTHLICYRLDRISRNVADFATTLEVLNKYNVSFISIKEQFDTSNAMGRAMMNISATFAQLERETIAERIKDNLRELSKTGRWLGGPAPLGYKSIEVENNDKAGKSRKKHILEINKDEEHIVKTVFSLFEEYKSFQKVSRMLEARKIYSRSNKVFSRELVKQMIINPTYAIADKNILNYLKQQGAEVYGYENINNSNGIMAYNRRKENGSFAPIDNWIISVGDHEGIIKSSSWIRCNELVKSIRLNNSSNRKGTGEKALLSGLVVCGKCNCGMAPRTNSSGKYMYRYYSCNLRNKASGRCKNDALNAYDAEEFVVNALKNLTKEEMIENYSYIKNKNLIKINNKISINNYKKEIENNKKIIKGLVVKMALLENDIEILDIFKNNIKAITEKNKELEQKILKLKQENDEIIDINETVDEMLLRLDNFKKFFDYTEDFEEKKNMIKNLIKFIIWNSDTRKLELVLIGSDKERPLPYYLPLSKVNRGTVDLKVKTKDVILNIKKRKKRNI